MKIRFGWARCPQGHDYDPTYGPCPQCHPRSLPFWFHSHLRAALVSLIVTWSIIAIIITAHAAPQSSLSVMVVSQEAPIGGQVVTATSESAIVTVATDADGFASFGNLPGGDWLVTACGQTITYTSSPGSDDLAAIWYVDCWQQRVWLPVVGG